jgi:diguanylate cyclase (GGDEF)-like protein
VRVATHRLSRALARATGVRNVSEVAVRNAARAVRAQVAAFAVANSDGQTMTIMATHGYPLTLVEHLRIPRGVGVLGSVFESGLPMRVNDVTTLYGARLHRSRYRTKSFAVVPISVGQDVLGALCVTDRADGRAFTHGDVSTLRTLAATVALALVRERAFAQADSYAQAAAIDPVSGLFNRRYFQARLEEELQRAQRHALSVGLLMIDVDDFKSINDRFGHLAGDAVIRDIGEILRRSVRVFDVCTRFGGEEFAVVMPGSGRDDGARIAERIRERIEAYRTSEPGLESLQITASIGLSVSVAATSARDLINFADQALYQAKRSGKNQVRSSGVTDARDSRPL